ncbi:MAG: NADH-quinone oxidoreductase subunit L [Coriobacteriales bacterium]
MGVFFGGPGVLVVAPLLIALLTVAGGKRAVGFTRFLTLAGPAVVAVAGFAHLAAARTETGFAPLRDAAWSVSWLGQEAVSLDVGFVVDNLSGVMLAVVGVVAFAVVLFSVGYMSEDSAQPRYFALLSLFTAAMTALVLADSLVTLFIGWELVGACSYLLIGFWYQRPAAAKAAVKAFLTTRIGDVGILLALALLWHETGTLSISGVLEAVPQLDGAVVTWAALLLFLGAAGKSAQFPLHIWLPDAMEGPTPVSALIHAATMVASGVYLIARMWQVFEASQTALDVILAVGTFTAIFAATIAVVQTDIKKVLAYSTISQLGFMFAALGAGAWVAAMFHLVTHAAFKALLFLASGSVIHGAGTQDLREMGGLAKSMPLTAVTWLVGALALSGWWPMAGFFSKDEVVAQVMHSSPAAGGVLLVASVLTAFYVFRATGLAFFGKYRGNAHVHESSWTMTVPLAVLAVLAATLGFTRGAFSTLMGHEVAEADVTVMVLALAAAAVGTFGALFVYSRGSERVDLARERFPRVIGVIGKGYGIDGLVDTCLVKPTLAVSAVLADPIDQRVIDGTVEGVGRGTVWLGRVMASLESGETDTYVSLLGVGFVVLMAIALWMGRG